jgi:hypothetical protein
MKVMLLFPPNWTPTMPHLALPTLTAFLRAHGAEVIQRDLNIEVFDEVLTRRHIERAVYALRRDYGPRAERRAKRPVQAPRDRVLWALSNGPQIAAQVEKAKGVVRSGAFFDGPLGLRAFETIAQALEIASLPFYPAALDISTYRPALTADSSQNLLREVADPHFNLLLEIYRKGVLADIERERPDVVGISIPSMAQLLPGLTIGHLIKQRGLACHVTVGGPHITMLREQLATTPAIFSCFDSAVVFDGEVPLLRLAEAVSAGASLDAVPNLVWRDGAEVRVNERKSPEKIGALPTPDFDGLPLERYLAPRRALPLLTARGCYFGKCAFCNVGYGEAEVFSQLKPEPLLDQMLRLTERHGSRRVFFVDEAMPPRLIRDVAPELERLGTPLRWGGCMRFEKVIDRPLLDTARRGGCAMILYGLESASQRVMDFMIKGTQLPVIDRVLRDSHEAGIWNHTFFFFGFPSETIEDAKETANFVWAHGDYINSAAMGTFLLERYAPAHSQPKVFGISRVIERPDADLQFYFDYEVESGVDAETAELIASGVEQSLPAKPFPQFYVSDVYRFLYASYRAERSAELPAWIPQAAGA